jgi:hypothetical protein
MNYECECGERYLTVSAARGCRKCRVYLADDAQTGRVTDLRSGEEIAPGPSAAELANYEAWKAEQGLA